MKWLHDRSSDAGIAAKISVLVETYSLFLIAGNPSLGLWNRLEILARLRQEELIWQEFPVFSLPNRDLPTETSSSQTASTAI